MNVKILVLGVFFSIDGQELSESLMATRCAEETWKQFRPCWKLLQEHFLNLCLKLTVASVM